MPAPCSFRGTGGTRSSRRSFFSSCFFHPAQGSPLRGTVTQVREGFAVPVPLHPKDSNAWFTNLASLFPATAFLPMAPFLAAARELERMAAKKAYFNGRGPRTGHMAPKIAYGYFFYPSPFSARTKRSAQRSAPPAMVCGSSRRQPKLSAMALSPHIAISQSRAISSSVQPCFCQAFTSGQ